MIPISKVQLPDEVEGLVLEVLRSGALAQGRMVEALESWFAETTGATHAIAVNSGTTALVAPLEALDLAPGAEVITSPFTFVATINAILEAGARVVFADVRLDDALIDPDAVDAAVTERTQVVAPVHLYGQMADMARLAQTADTNGLRILEDAAQAHLATRDGLVAGSGDIAAFSLYGTKNLTTAEGGMITTSDDELAAQLRILRNQGMRQRYEYVMAGHNYRLTDVHAAIGVAQLPHIDRSTENRRHNAARLSEGLVDLPGIAVLSVAANSNPVWHQFTVRVTDEARLDRDQLTVALAEHGVGSGVYYPSAVYDYDCYREHPDIDITPNPHAEQLGREVLSLPVHPHLAEGDLDQIVSTMRRFLDD